MTTLLILDDTPDQLKDIVNAATDAGFARDEIRTASNLETANVLLDEGIQIAVIDVHLGMGLEEAGVDFIGRLRRAKPRCKIIALTTKAPNAAGVRALAFGADDFINGNGKYDLNWNTLLHYKLSLFKELVEKYPNDAPVESTSRVQRLD